MSGKGHTGCALTFAPAAGGDDFHQQGLGTQHNTEAGALGQPADPASLITSLTRGGASCSSCLISLDLSFFLICKMDQIILARLEAESCWGGVGGTPSQYKSPAGKWAF